MPAIIAALIAGGASFGQGALASRSARKERHKRSKRLKRAIGATESIMGKGLSQQEALARLATKKEVGGYDAAIKEATRAAAGERQRLLDREQQMSASLSQGLTNANLKSTTRGGNLQRGLAADTSRGFLDISSSLADQLGGLQLGRAEAESQGLANLGNIAAQRSDLMSGLAQMGLMGGQRLGQFDIGPWSQPNLGQNALTGLQTGLGAYMGMQGGGQNQDMMQMLQEIFGQMQRRPGVNQMIQPGGSFVQGAY